MTAPAGRITDAAGSRLSSVVSRALSAVIPSAKSAAEKAEIAADMLGRVQKCSSTYPDVKEVVLGGSFSKGTWLPDLADIDVMVKFEETTPRGRFTDVARRVGFEALSGFDPYVRYAEHPFVEAQVRGTKINVVPCFDVRDGKWQSAADRTPHHTRFMRENLSASMKNEVRLLKLFIKSGSLYGAEISKQGFSGYLTEVLVWHFGSFEGVVRQLAGIRRGTVIGDAGRRFETPIVVVDPVDPNRNLAAAVSGENIGRLILRCRAFLTRPSLSFFSDRGGRFRPEILKSCVTVRFRYRARSPDMIWGQLRRAASALSAQLGQGGFTVIRSGALTDECGHAALFFLLKSEQISEYRVREGPDLFYAEDTRRFAEKNAARSKLLWLGTAGRLHSLERRPERSAKRFLRALLANGLESSGIPEGIRSDVAGGFQISLGEVGLNEPIKTLLREELSTDAAILCPG